MTTSEWHLTFSTMRKMMILVYNVVVLTSLIATATRDLNCDIGVLPLDESEPSPMHTRPAMAKTNDAWRRRVLYAAAAVAAGTTKYERVHPQPPSTSTPNNEQFGTRSSRSNSTDGHIISQACDGTHGLELQQDNTTVYLEGLPVYHVTVINTCLDCSLQDIHIACGDWASATEVNPLVFKRVAYNDCILNDGNPISSQGVVFFEYTNSFPYPMHVESSSLSC